MVSYVDNYSAVTAVRAKLHLAARKMLSCAPCHMQLALLQNLINNTAIQSFKFFPYSAFAIIIILGGTLTTSLILANVLIAQLSESYAVSKSNAILHYDIAKLKFVTRMENSRFKCLVRFHSPIFLTFAYNLCRDYLRE